MADSKVQPSPAILDGHSGVPRAMPAAQPRGEAYAIAPENRGF
jgi:hypothetical protein